MAKMVGIRISEELRTRLGIAVSIKRVSLQDFANELLRETLKTYGVLDKNHSFVHSSIDRRGMKRNHQKAHVSFFFRIDADLYGPLVEVLITKKISQQQFLTEVLSSGIEKIEMEYTDRVRLLSGRPIE